MELLQGDAFDRLFRTFHRTAFHLELQDSYDTPEEAGPFQLFLTGQHDDFAWHETWLALVREATAQGKAITRARIVSVPHGDYTRWGMTVAPKNIEAGEAIRWLPRHLANDLQLPADDYWLFDDQHVVFTIFEPGGRFGGGAQTRDRVIVDRCRAARDSVWHLAIPHHEYAASEYSTA